MCKFSEWNKERERERENWQETCTSSIETTIFSYILLEYLITLFFEGKYGFWMVIFSLPLSFSLFLLEIGFKISYPAKKMSSWIHCGFFDCLSISIYNVYQRWSHFKCIFNGSGWCITSVLSFKFQHKSSPCGWNAFLFVFFFS